MTNTWRYSDKIYTCPACDALVLGSDIICQKILNRTFLVCPECGSTIKVIK